MAVGDQQHRGVAVTVAAVLRGGDQALDLIERKGSRERSSAFGRRRAMSGATVCSSVVGTTNVRFVFTAILSASQVITVCITTLFQTGLVGGYEISEELD
jgi:hypothetical protein